MIEAYIIEKLKREKEELEREGWKPIPLPLEEYDPRYREKDPDAKEKREKRQEFVVEIMIAGGINGSATRP
jgi:hypothetical protein